MGQGALQPVPDPLMGEVDVGLEALFLLESPEEEISRVVRVLPPSPPQVPPRRASRMQRRRTHKGSSIRKKREDEDSSCDCSHISPTPQHVIHMDTEQQQLADVYYSAFHLHPPCERLVQEGSTCGAVAEDVEIFTSTIVTREELRKELREIFEVDYETMTIIENEVKMREPPHTTLHVKVHEAKDLKPKTPKETSHPYCVVRVTGSEDTHRTAVLPSTLNPAWETEFQFWIPCLQDAKLVVEIWHEPQEAGVEQLMGMRDLRELGRLVRDAASNLQTRETRNLLGSVTIPLTDVKDQSVEGWYNLVKGKEEGVNQLSHKENLKRCKKRGSVHISLRLSTDSQLNLFGPHWYNGFLNKMVEHHLKYISSFSHRRGGSRRSDRSILSLRSNFHSTRSCGILITRSNSTRTCRSHSESPTSSGSSYENEMTWNLITPWNGRVNEACSSLLNYYSTTLGLSPAAVTLAWWNVVSKFSVVDQVFLGELLKTMQTYLSDKKYSEQEIEEIQSSLRLWITGEINRLRSLTTHFPAASSKIVSYAQIKGMLKNFLELETNQHTQNLKIFPKNVPVTELVAEGLMDFSKSWWEATLKSRCRDYNAATIDQQLDMAVGVGGEICSFLSEVSNFYHDVFFREARVSYLRLAYTLLTSELAAYVRPLLHKIYDNPTGKRRCSHTPVPYYEESDKYALEAGSPVWHLYKKLEFIHKIGENLPVEVQLESAIRGYHQWFLGGVTRWQNRLLTRTRDLLAKEVNKDSFEPDSSGISSSASGIKSNFAIIVSLWEKLSWPDYENFVGKQLLQELCGLGTLYTKLIVTKMEARAREESTLESSLLPAHSCTGLNNIEFVRREVGKLPKLCGLADEYDDDQFSVPAKALSKMEGSIMCFLDSAIRKMMPALLSAVERSCETGNEAPLLQDALDQGLCVLRDSLNENTFQHFLLKIWNTIVTIFGSIVERSSTKRKAEFFKNVYRVLERTWYFFTPADSRGLDPHLAHTAEYQALQKTLCNLKMPTESLIAKYYKERYEELQRTYHACSVELVVRVFFLVTGKLIVEVIMARNIVRSSVKPPDTFVQVKLVPSDWFPNATSHKTKIQKKCNSPVFEEKFELPVSPDESSVRNGHILFLLKTRQFFQSSEGFAETVLPLDDIPSVDTHTAAHVKNKILIMNLPKIGDDYTAIKALKFRTWDKRAISFLQKIPFAT